MELNSCISKVLQGELTASGLCSNVWKTGSGGRWVLGKLSRRGITPKISQRTLKSPTVPVKSAISTSGGRNGPSMYSSFGARDVRWLDHGGIFSLPGRPSTAIEAGRSKVKKGQTSGGRIEKRPFSTRSPKPSNPAELKEGSDGANQGGQQGGDTVSGQIEGRRNRGRLDEDELNSTWEELGLGDRRSRGRFLPDRGTRPKEATRMGGWGRDKSMQRVITADEQRAARGGRRERTRSGVRQKTETSGAPVVKKKKKKWDADFDPDPRIRHPPDYYTNGPYGPHAWKGRVVGKIIEGDMSTNQVFYFSSVKDIAEDEDRSMANAAVDYTNMVNTFDPTIGIQYYYAFARRRLGPRPDPWEDWTLVAQIAIETGKDLGDQGEIFRKMGSQVQDITTQCVAWARPDLTYVKRPNFQLLLESQEKFLLELFTLLDPTKDGKDSDSYYATLCRLLHVGVAASPGRLRNAYETLEEPGKMECLKHLLTKHPVQILPSARHERQLGAERGELRLEEGTTDFTFEEETDDESTNVDAEESHQAGNGAGLMNYDESMEIRATNELEAGSTELEGRPGMNYEESMETRGVNKLEASSTEQEGRANNANPKPRRRPMKLKRVHYPPVVRSAARPYSYSDVIQDIGEIRSYLCRKPSMASVN